MPETVQGEFLFANDFRLALRVSAAAKMADIPEESIVGLVQEGKLDAVLVNTNPHSPRKHRRILANSLWTWLGREWRFEAPVKPSLRPDEVADLFDVSARHVRRLEAAGALAGRRYGARKVLRLLRTGLDRFIVDRKTAE